MKNTKSVKSVSTAVAVKSPKAPIKAKKNASVAKVKATAKKGASVAKKAKKVVAKAKAKQPFKVQIPVALSDKFIELINAGVSQKDIATAMGCSTASVTRWVYRKRGNIPLNGTVLGKSGKPRFPHAEYKTYNKLVALCNKFCKENKIKMPTGI